MNSTKKIVILLCSLCLLSCAETGGPEDLFENYVYRLSNSLDVSRNPSLAFEGNSHGLLRYPARRDIAHSISGTKINLIEFLRLSECDLQRLVGERNSSLGKFSKPSQTLFYEFKFIELAKVCLEHLEKDSVLHNTLSQVLEEKTATLSLVKWNAVFASEEFSQLFSLGTKPLSYKDLRLGISNLFSALDRIKLFVEGKFSESVSVEQSYGIVNSSKRIGEIRLSMAQSSNYLKTADQLLIERINNKPLCYNERANTRFSTVNNVFKAFYLGEVQPYLALLHQQGKSVFSKIESLSEKKYEKKEFAQFWDSVYRDENSEWKVFDKAIQNHTKNWQLLLAQCGSMPQ